MDRARGAVGAIAAAVLTLSACGGGSDGRAETAAHTPSPGPSSSFTPLPNVESETCRTAAAAFFEIPATLDPSQPMAYEEFERKFIAMSDQVDTAMWVADAAATADPGRARGRLGRRAARPRSVGARRHEQPGSGGPGPACAGAVAVAAQHRPRRLAQQVDAQPRADAAAVLGRDLASSSTAACSSTLRARACRVAQPVSRATVMRSESGPWRDMPRR
jgi:hypothetical protein